MNLQPKKMVILDRDGVINYDSDEFIKNPDEWRPIPGSLSAIKKLNDARIIVTVASNQSGVARGLFSESTLDMIHKKFTDLLAEMGAHIDQIEYCAHGPDDNCECRKPKAGMISKLLKQFNIASQDALVVGDAFRDLQAGQAAGCDVVLVKTGKGEKTLAENKITVPVFADLRSVVDEMLAHG
jgi:D-glycero-D-manno-heptose 1,7-bisphosphate phosphatase